VIVKKSGGSTRYLHLNANRGRFSISTAGQIGGHTAANSAISVAAVSVTNAVGGVFFRRAANPVETFSSDGPRRVFYAADGSPITPGNYTSSGGTVRQKPDVAAADNVSCATPGFNPFLGTSAAAPHAAGLAALMMGRGLTSPQQIRQALTNGTWDIEAAGYDAIQGSALLTQ
jgi:subtilisin family serine protease